MTKNKCQRYAQAITDSVLGETIDVPKEELMGHLKECAKCRQEATNWQDFQNALRVKEYHARPEVKEKWDKFIGELTGGATATKRSPVRGEKSPDVSSGGQPRPAPARLTEPVGPVRVAPGEKFLDHKEHIGSAAGVVWHYLGKYGKTDLTDLPQKAKLSPLNAYESVGWLAHEKKIYRSYDEQTTYAWLNEHEQEIYRQEQAQAQV